MSVFALRYGVDSCILSYCRTTRPWAEDDWWLVGEVMLLCIAIAAFSMRAAPACQRDLENPWGE